jgi:cation:H+ antiporter
MTLLMLVGGLVLLVVGAEWLVRGASRLAAAIGIPPLVIGLTVVAFGTSAPEMAVSLKAVMAGQAGIAVGNVVGSNIFNVLCILGVSALIVPLTVSQQLIRFDVPLMIAASVVVWLLAGDRALGRYEGALLFGALIVYTAFLIYYGRKKEQPSPEQEAVSETRAWGRHLAFIGVGLAMLVFGSRWLVDGAISIAQWLGVSEVVIGLTVVAVGTSLPEVVTSVVASLRGERDIAVGNVVGSNLFNLLGVLGLAALFAPEAVPVASSVVGFDLPVMIAVAFVCLPIFFTGGRISRWEGGLLLAYFAAYTTYLILATSHHDALPEYSAVMLDFVLPLTGLTLLVLTIQAIRKRKHRKDV